MTLDEKNEAGARLLAAWKQNGWIEKIEFPDGVAHITWSDEGKMMVSCLRRILAVYQTPTTEADLFALAWLSLCDSNANFLN